LFERDEFLLYIMARLLYVFFILVSGFVLPLWNPVLAFADASIWPQHLMSLRLAGLKLHGWSATVVLHLLIGGGGFIIACVCGRWIQRRAVSSVANERDAEGV
jgi:hypothetical protein